MQDLHHKEGLPPAHQQLTARDRVTRWAICPLHEKRTSNFVGVVSNESGKSRWCFRCTYSDHVFAAVPDRTAPKPGDELGWVAREKEKRLRAISRSNT